MGFLGNCQKTSPGPPPHFLPTFTFRFSRGESTVLLLLLLFKRSDYRSKYLREFGFSRRAPSSLSQPLSPSRSGKRMRFLCFFHFYSVWGKFTFSLPLPLSSQRQQNGSSLPSPRINNIYIYVCICSVCGIGQGYASRPRTSHLSPLFGKCMENGGAGSSSTSTLLLFLYMFIYPTLSSPGSSLTVRAYSSRR
jgi:hypothetical protein